MNRNDANDGKPHRIWNPDEPPTELLEDWCAAQVKEAVKQFISDGFLRCAVEDGVPILYFASWDDPDPDERGYTGLYHRQAPLGAVLDHFLNMGEDIEDAALILATLEHAARKFREFIHE